MRPLKIHLCDLTHETVILVSDVIPINIGFIGSYIKKLYGNALDISLFKYPQSAISAVKNNPPDILALSNYSWNSNLSEHVASIAKSVNENVLTVQGGTNFPIGSEQQLAFLKNRPSTDIYVELEGEVAFANIVARALAAREGGGGVFDAPIEGCMFIQPETRLEAEPVLVKGANPPRLKDLDEIPSPYLNGMLDQFFDGRLAPFIETNRGCPFKCSFCHTGNDYFRKINMFSLDRVKEELDYIAVRAAENKSSVLHIADTNFGMFPRDREICEALLKVREQYKWPLSIDSTTGKNNKERVIDITGILGNTFNVTMSVQSMDDAVLSNIERSNIKLDDYMKINQHLRDVGRGTTAELIMGLPGETKESFTRGVEQVIDSGVSTVTIYTLMMLYGTKFKDPSYRGMFGMEGKHRIVPMNFGDYDGKKIFDYEEACIRTTDMSFEDYLDLRRLALLVETTHNNRAFEEFYRYALSLGVERSAFLFLAFSRLDWAPEDIQQNFREFMEETQSELWDSEQEMIRHYREPENYERLLKGEVGGNLIYKYKSKNLATSMPSWIDFLSGLLLEVVAQADPKSVDRKAAQEEIEALAAFCHNKIFEFLKHDADGTVTELESFYDFPAWLEGAQTIPLSEYRSDTPRLYFFKFTDAQVRIRRDLFRKYGTDIRALSRIVTRVRLEHLFRTVVTDLDEAGDDEILRPSLTRYAMSH